MTIPYPPARWKIIRYMMATARCFPRYVLPNGREAAQVKEKKEDTFSPLGNATFTLYLTDANGTQIQLLDTLTTGLDNTTIGDYKPAGEDTDTAGDTGVGTGRQDADGTGEGTTEESTEGLTAWASSKAFLSRRSAN